jgi:hypothetical protein
MRWSEANHRNSGNSQFLAVSASYSRYSHSRVPPAGYRKKGISVSNVDFQGMEIRKSGEKLTSFDKSSN